MEKTRNPATVVALVAATVAGSAVAAPIEIAQDNGTLKAVPFRPDGAGPFPRRSACTAAPG